LLIVYIDLLDLLIGDIEDEAMPCAGQV